MKKYIVFTVFFLSILTLSNAQQKSINWSKWKYLAGNWEGVGTGKPGEGTGYFSFKFELDSNVLIRKNHAEYPATDTRPETIHDDMLIIYSDTSGNPGKALYFDNEGHIIKYKIEYFDISIIMTSISDPGSYRFRLTYVPVDDKTVSIKFEMADPKSPDKFFTYLEGKAIKKD